MQMGMGIDTNLFFAGNYFLRKLLFPSVPGNSTSNHILKKKNIREKTLSKTPAAWCSFSFSSSLVRDITNFLFIIWIRSTYSCWTIFWLKFWKRPTRIFLAQIRTHRKDENRGYDDARFRELFICFIDESRRSQFLVLIFPFIQSVDYSADDTAWNVISSQKTLPKRGKRKLSLFSCVTFDSKGHECILSKVNFIFLTKKSMFFCKIFFPWQ